MIRHIHQKNHSMMTWISVVVVVVVAVIKDRMVVVLPAVHAIMPENERMEEFYKRGYEWPIQNYVPNTPGWKKLMEHRFRQIAEIPHPKDRYEGYLQAVSSSILAPNFTQYGFGLARAPESLMKDLRQGIHVALEAQNYTLEEDVELIDGDQAWFVDRPDLTQRVLDELHHYSETWANMELTPNNAYGFRLYRNQSSLHMHVDKPQTHIISFILHIDSSEDAEPWPILIEDFQGQTHEVILTSGDMLFYESSKCFHGRPHTFHGSWYSSVFVHYYPKYGWSQMDHQLERHFAVPGHWSNEPNPYTSYEIPIQMSGTGMFEPTCPNRWCNSQRTVKWSGPGKEGYYIAPTMENIPFHPETSIFAPSSMQCRDHYLECQDWITWETKECERNAEWMHIHCQKSCGLCTPQLE